MNNVLEKSLNEILGKLEENGAYKTAVIDVKEVVFNTVFRDICATNACGKYGRNHMCPPDIGDINELIDKAKSFDKVLVYQTITELEDSFDIEGMESAAVLHNKLARLLRVEMDKLPLVTLNLAAGGCQMCKVCAKIDNKPCRHPDEAMSSLEAHGISVSDLAASCGMKYINGKDTVTFFGSVFFKEMKID